MRDSLLATCTLSSSGMGPFTATAHETTNLGRHRRAEHVSRKREISIGPKQARRAHGGAPDRGASRGGGAAVSPTSSAEPRRGARRSTKEGEGAWLELIPFSAFWLRSSVVSVLISVISHI